MIYCSTCCIWYAAYASSREFLRSKLKNNSRREGCVVGLLDGRAKGGQWDNTVTREHYNLDTKASFQIARHGC